jgi:hypothetical protein
MVRAQKHLEERSTNLLTSSRWNFDPHGDEEAQREKIRKRQEAAKILLRQGDLLLRGCLELPEGLSPRASTVLAEGEVTGHTHQLLEGRVWADARGTLYLEVPQATQVVHQEHRPLTLAPGYYLVIRQREYTPQEIRRVSD